MGELKNQKEGEVTEVGVNNQGRKVILEEELDDIVKRYVQGMCSAGTPIGTKFVMAGTEDVVKVYGRTLLFENGGHISLTRNWALSILGRMVYLRCKAATMSKP